MCVKKININIWMDYQLFCIVVVRSLSNWQVNCFNILLINASLWCQKNITPNEGHSIQPRQCARWKMNGFPHNACILNVIDHTCINNPWNSHMWRNKSTLRFYLQIIWKCIFVSFSETFYASLPPNKDIQPVAINVILWQSAPLNPHSVMVDVLDRWEWGGPETDLHSPAI